MPRGSQPGPRPGQRKANEIRIEGDIAYVTLTQGQVAIIDTTDIPLIQTQKWMASKNADVGYYAMYSRRQDGRKYVRYMHRYIMDAPDGQTVDHINHDPLDNRRSNLRVVPNWQNTVNRKVKSQYHTHSGIRGVSVFRAKWGGVYYMARVQVARYFPYTEEGLKQAEACAIELRQRIAQLADDKLIEGTPEP